MKMETNLYDYDTTVQWTPQQNPPYEGRFVTAQAGQQQLPRPRDPRLPQPGAGQKPTLPEKSPKARALALAQHTKKCVAVVSIVSFATFTALVALHPARTTTLQS